MPQLVHIRDGTTHTLASSAAVATSWWAKARGLIGTTTVPDEYALVLPFDTARSRTIHMLGVRTALDVLWIVDTRVRRVETLPAWRGLGRARADVVVELPPGAAGDVERGDRVSLANTPPGQF